MKSVFALFLAFSLFAGSAVNAFAEARIYDVRGKKTIPYSQFIDGIKGAGIVFLGETHDNAKQHKEHLEIIRSLHAIDKNIAIGLEMFTADNQQQLDDWSSGRISEEDFKKIYAKNWSYDWSLYRDIFIFARDNRIPMIALNVPKPLVSKIVKQGHAGLKEDDLKALPPQMSWTLHPAQMEYLQAIRAQNFGNRPSPIPLANFTDAQAARNSMMAWRVSAFKQKSPKTRVIAIAGTWHAIRNGAPDGLSEYGGADTKVVLPELPEFVIQNATPDEADFFIMR